MRWLILVPCLVGACALGACSDDATAAKAGVDATLDTAVDAHAGDAAADVADLDAADATPDTTRPVDPQRLRVMTYNVMCSFCMFQDHPGWESKWLARVPWLKDVIARHDPDLVGLQELQDINKPAGLPSEISQLTEPEGVYGAVFYRWQPGDAIEADYPDAAVLYRKSRFSLLDQGQYWLGPQPDVAFSSGFAAKPTFPRLVVWSLLRDGASGRDLYFASTHFDNNTPNQEHSAPLSLDRFAPLAAQHPVVFVGDFNAKPDSKAYAILATGKGADVGRKGTGFAFQNAFDLAPKWQIEADPGATPAYDTAQRIDHFWLAGAAFAVERWVVDLRTYGAQHQVPSDHDAMVTDLVWPMP